MRVFLENRPMFPVEEWLRYLDQWVAFSWDGTSILASDPDLLRLETKLRQLGIDPQDVGFEFVAPAEAADAGGQSYTIEAVSEKATSE